MEPQNHWLVEDFPILQGTILRVHVSFGSIFRMYFGLNLDRLHQSIEHHHLIHKEGGRGSIECQCLLISLRIWALNWKGL